MSIIKHDCGAWTALACYNGRLLLAEGETRTEARNNAIDMILGL